jgi:hypothetical protein
MGFDMSKGLALFFAAPEARFSRIISAIRRYKFALAAFLLPLTVRAIPEVIAGPYPIGWDIIAFYVPNTLDMAAGRMNIWGILGSGPLMYSFIVPIYVLTRINPILLFKVAGPALFGVLCWSVFRLCEKRLGLSIRSAFLSVIFLAFYFVSLRVAWDAYQAELGLTLFILGLSVAGEPGSVGRSIFAKSAFFLLAILANQLVAVLVVGSVIVEMLRAKVWGGFGLSLSRLAPVALFGLAVYATLQPSTGPGVSVLGGSFAPLNVAYNTVFLVYAFGPLLPLAAIGLSLVTRSLFSSWIVVAATGIVISTLPGQVFQDIGYRWVLLLSVPVLIAAAQGYQKVSARAGGLNGRKWLKAVRLGVPLVLILSAGMYSAIQEASVPYFTLFVGYVPTSLLQSSVPLSDSANVVQAMHWLEASMPNNSAVITHEAFYGWARTYLTPDKTIINSLLNSPSSELSMVASYGHVFTIWWVPGSGWFSPTFPTGASISATFGDIAVYEYR